FGLLKSEDVEKYLENRADSLVLIVTENCNLRCKYCLYMNNYEDFRGISNRNMSFNIAFKAIKYFLNKKAKNDNIPFICFTGGEPLLKWDLIEEIISKTTKQFHKENIKWFFNTNGVLLTEEKFNFLKEMKIIIKVSLDGPKKIHDKYRVDSNLRGTFDRVFDNINKLRNKFPKYYRKYVSISFVIAEPEKLSKIRKFFLENEVLKNIPKLCSQVYNLKLKNKELYQPLKLEDYNKEMEEYIKFISHNDSYKFPFNFWWAKYLLVIYNRDINPLESNKKMINTYVPGAHRLVVHPDGEYGFCIQGAESFRIGNVEAGLNFEKLFKIINKTEKFLSEHCINCWAFRICPICIGFFTKNSNLSEKLFFKSCYEIKHHLNSVFELYLKINKLNPDLLNNIYPSD
ncbi:MAG: radical SAM protein, partial [Promethearchaeota archaeon]